MRKADLDPARARNLYLGGNQARKTDQNQKLRQRSLEELARHYLEETSRLGCSLAEAKQVLETVIRLDQAGSSENPLYSKGRE